MPLCTPPALFCERCRASLATTRYVRRHCALALRARHGWTAHPPRLQMVVVLDMGDVQPCEVGVGGCPQDGHFQFNTQVAFDQEGR